MTFEEMDTPGAAMHDVITKMIRDMKIVGLFYVIAGAINCLTIIGAIVGIPYIFAGLRLRESAGEYIDWLNHEPGALFRALEKQQKHFFIMMVMLVVGLVLTVLIMAIAMALLAAGIFAGMEG